MLAGGVAGLLVAMGLMIVRLLRGPTAYDRVLAVNSFGTKTVLMIALMGFAVGRPDFLDVAIVYALINFISTIALMKVFRLRSLAEPLARLSVSREGPDG
jgi:multicomponent Na+:H+ antiporter subunit F